MPEIYLTRRAAANLLEMEAHSLQNWGTDRTRKYMDDVHKALRDIAHNPQWGQVRWRRSRPFLMAPTQTHFAIYRPLGENIVVATLLHKGRDIEAIIRKLRPQLEAEIARIEKEAQP